MDRTQDTENVQERKRGQHLRLEDRGAIQSLHRMGFSLRKIAGEVNCSPGTVLNELRRGTAVRKSGRGRKPTYKARTGQIVYESNRRRCHKKMRVDECQNFIKWMENKVKSDKWSIDTCVGYARRTGLFSMAETGCTSTWYTAIRKNHICIKPLDLPEMVRRRKRKYRKTQKSKCFGRSIETRPPAVNDRTEFGHWEADTVTGTRKRDSVILTLLEKQTSNNISIYIENKTSESVQAAFLQLIDLYGTKFNEVFKSITSDNGTEFSRLTELESFGTKVYFSHPYSAWERGQNEKYNGMLRRYIPKGVPISNFTCDEVASIGDYLNALPRRSLGYRTPEELFDAALDRIYAMRDEYPTGCSS